MQPDINIFGVTIHTFGVMFGLGFLAAGWIIAVRLKELGKPVDWSYEIAFAALVGGVIGAKLWYVIEAGDAGSLFSGNGLVWYGGALGGAAGVLLWGKRRDMLNVTLLDLCAPALALGYAIGRIGCQLSGDGDYGIPSDLPWAMSYPHGTVPTTQEVHPTPIYETLTMLGVTWFLWRRRDRMPPGGLFALYLLLAGTERFLVEFIRRNDEVLLGLTLAQYFSLAMMIAGGIWLLRLRSAPQRASREPVRAARQRV